MNEFAKALSGTPKEFMEYVKGFPKFQRANLCLIYIYLYVRGVVGGKE